jgi:hypothetical protein
MTGDSTSAPKGITPSQQLDVIPTRSHNLPIRFSHNTLERGNPTVHYKYSEDAPLPPVENLPVGLRNAALAYAHMGIAILPVRAGTKKANPKELGGVGYRVSDAGITNTERVTDIYTRTPGTNIGFVTGSVNGFMVIDIDRKRRGPDPIKALAKWQEETGIEIPIGPTASTPGDGDGTEGMHIYLALPEDMEPLGCVNGWLPNVDIRCDGGYVLAPPSYRQVKRRTDNECPEERESGTACLDSQCPFKLVEDWAQYEWVDLAGSPYSPTPAEWRAELEAAVAPAELIADIRRWGHTRSRPKELRHLPRGARGTGGGLQTVEWYRTNGLPDGLVQWDVLYFDIAWPLLNAGVDRAACVAIMRKILDHPGTSLVRSWEPWITGSAADGTAGQTLWAITNRAYERAERMDGDAYHQAKRTKQFDEKYGDLLKLDLFRRNNTKGTAQ